MTVTKARRVLGADCPMTDEEVAAMLDQLRRIASLALDATGNKDGPGPGRESHPR